MSNFIQGRSMGIVVVAISMIIFGLAEIITGFTHNFIGLISTSSNILSTYGASGIGALYAVGGLLLLTKRKVAAKFALACLVVVIVGRIFLVLAGLYPISSFLQSFSIIVGTTIAVIFAIYIALEVVEFFK